MNYFQLSSDRLHVPEHKQFLKSKTVQFLNPGGVVRLTKSFITGGSSVADNIPQRLHFLTLLPGTSFCFRKVSHNVVFGGGSRCCAAGALIIDNPNQVVSKKMTAGISNGDSGPIKFPVTV